MGTRNGFYVRAQDGDKAVVSAIREKFPAKEIEATSQFIGVKMSEDEYVAPENDLASLSSRCGTDVIWLGFQSTVDAFQFHHWRSGIHVRALVYGCFQEERTWERADGQPEPWEREVFFSQDKLDRVLEYVESEPERLELQRVWREGDILPGKTEPGLDSRDCAHAIAAYYQLPHYGS